MSNLFREIDRNQSITLPGNLLVAVEKITEPVFQESPHLILVRARARAASA